MQIQGWGAFGALALAAIAAAHQAATANLGMWLAYGLAAFALVAAVDPIARIVGRRAFHRDWGKVSMFIAIGIIGAAGALVVGTAFKWSVESYRSEQKAIEDKRRDDEIRRAQEQRLVADLIRVNEELGEQRRRNDEAEARRERQLARYQIANGQLAEAMALGGTLRYRIEDGIRIAVQGGTFAEFDAAFDANYTPAIETWRGQTAAMLDRELPGAHLGTSFSEILGEYGRGRSGFRFTQIRACLESLARTQRELRSHIELIVR